MGAYNATATGLCAPPSLYCKCDWMVGIAHRWYKNMKVGPRMDRHRTARTYGVIIRKCKNMKILPKPVLWKSTALRMKKTTFKMSASSVLKTLHLKNRVQSVKDERVFCASDSVFKMSAYAVQVHCWPCLSVLRKLLPQRACETYARLYKNLTLEKPRA